MLRKYFMKGLQALLPVALTVAIVYWLLNTLEVVFEKIITLFLPEQYYYWGMGLIAGIVFIFVLGIFVNFWLGEKIHDLIDHLFERIPLVKTIYNAIRDVSDYFDSNKKRAGNKVVMADVPHLGKIIGIVMREDLQSSQLSEHLSDEPQSMVYFPMGYQIGGYAVIIPDSQLTPLNMTVEEGLRLAITAGVNGLR